MAEDKTASPPAAEGRAVPRVEEARVVQLIVFHIGDEEFGVPIGGVREIVKAGLVTPIPDSPGFIRGLINVRGEIVATIDLRRRFFLPEEQVESKHILITQQEQNLFGILVDDVTEVLRVPEGEIKPPHKLMTSIHEEYVSGVVTHEGRLIILLDLAGVLSVEELAHLSEAARAHRGIVNAESETVKTEDLEAPKTEDGEPKTEGKAPRKRTNRKRASL